MASRSKAFLVTKQSVDPNLKTYHLTKDQIVLGRTVDCDIPLPSINVSRQHAILKCGPDDRWTVEDAQSLNGVYLNNQLIDKKSKHSLKDGDFISMGPPECSKHQFMFLQSSEPMPHPPVINPVFREENSREASSEDVASEVLAEADQLIGELSESVLQNLEKHTSTNQGASLSSTQMAQASSSPKEPKVLPEEIEKAASKARNETLMNVGSVMENEFTCAICTELFVHATTLNCSHTFCRWCIFHWKQTKKECPICRHPVSAETHSLVLDNFIEKMVASLGPEPKHHRQMLLDERKLKEQEMVVHNSGATKKRKLVSFDEMLEDDDYSLSEEDEDDYDSSYELDEDDVDGYYTIPAYTACLACGSLRGHRDNSCPLSRYR